MDEKLKYRLVGASVILALAVFFLPMILDSEKYRSQIQSQIPEIPSDSQSKQPDEPSPFQANGPVEKGPLVINLDDDTQQTNQDTQDPVTTTEPNDQTKQVDNTQQPVDKAEQVKTENEPEKEVATNPVVKQEPEQLAQVETKPTVETPSETQAEPQPKESSDSELAFSESAWLIQIGSFSNKENATKLVTSLRDQGYRAYQRVGDAYARVYVGPYPVKGEAEKRTGDLEKLVGSKVKVIEFDPKQH